MKRKSGLLRGSLSRKVLAARMEGVKTKLKGTRTEVRELNKKGVRWALLGIRDGGRGDDAVRRQIRNYLFRKKGHLCVNVLREVKTLPATKAGGRSEHYTRKSGKRNQGQRKKKVCRRS